MTVSTPSIVEVWVGLRMNIVVYVLVNVKVCVRTVVGLINVVIGAVGN